MRPTTNCDLCKLSKQRTQVLNGGGNFERPKLFVVIDAPSSDDDSCGELLSAGQGRVFSSLLSDAHLNRRDCYITSIVKCKTPNSRPADLDEISACQAHLRAEIERIKPSCILAMGDTASSVLIGKSLHIYRGSVCAGIGPATGYNVVPTYPPLFTMKQRAMFPVVVWDIAKVAKPKISIEENYILHPSREEIKQTLAYIQAERLPTAIDIETASDKEEGGKDDALNAWKGEIIGIAFCWKPGRAMQLDATTMLSNWDLVKIFLEEHKEQIYANNIFDRLFCWVNKQTRPQVLWDVQTAMHLIYAALPKKLDFLRSIYTDIPPYKDVYKKEAGGKYRPENLNAASLARLNCLDVDVTLRVYEEQLKYVSKELMASVWKEEEMALEMKHRGVYIDQNAVAAHYIKIKPEIARLEQKFLNDWSSSISSPKQLNQLLYDRLKFPKFNDKGKSCFSGASTNEKAIQSIASCFGLLYLNDEDGERFEGEHEHKAVLSDILTYRGLAKLSSTYCEGIFHSIQSDQRVHPGWKPTGTDTGRWSCVDVPMQGVPKDMRNIVRAAPGKILMGADYKGAQIIGAGILAEDWELVENMCKPEYSLHDEVLQAIKPFYPSIKKIQAKTVVFGTFFGRSVRDIASVFHVPQKTAQLWQDIFYTARPKLRELFEVKLPKEWETFGYIQCSDGRKKYCERVTEAKNTPVQNFESQLTKTAMWKLREEGYSLILMGHDQIVVEEPDDDTKDARYLRFIEIMETALPDRWPKFPVDGGMDYTWDKV